MKFSLDWLKEFVDIKEKPDALADLLTRKSFEVAEWHQKNDDTVLEIDILPNRPDALSHRGLAREIATLTQKKIQEKDFTIKEDSPKQIKDFLKVNVDDYDACPRYMARMIRNVTIKESPAWLKKRLMLLGLNPINNIVDATNYVMLEIGQPLHAFDYDKLAQTRNGKKEITVGWAKPREKIRTLDESETEYILDEDILTIRDAKGAVAIAGIKGGKGSEIGEKTSTVVIESANFSPSIVRRGGKRLNLNTDASIRFSYGVDFNLAEEGVNHAAALIQDLAGGEIIEGITDAHKIKPRPVKVSVKKDYFKNLIGADITPKTAISILISLGFVVEEKKDMILATVPSYRLDITTAEDLVEEVARVYGYDNIPPKPPLIGAFPESELSREEHLRKYSETKLWDLAEFIQFRDLVKNIFVGFGFSEAYNYSFISEDDKELFRYPPLVELENPLSHHARYLRPNLATNLLHSAIRNIKHDSNVRLFEIGRVFVPEETRRFGGIIALKGKTRIFFDIKGVVDAFLNSLGIASQHYDTIESWQAGDRIVYHQGISAEVKVNDVVVGVLGEINPRILSELDIKSANSFSGFEFNLESLLEVMQSEREFEPIPKFPAVVRDISLLVNRDVRISEILNKIEGADTMRIVEDVDVFDIFEDDPELPEGKKSVAFHVTYRLPDRTLTEREVAEVEESIKKALEEGLGAEVR